MGNRFLVAGGDAAGMSAAGKAKRDDPDIEVVVFERSSWASYGACGLPYYVKGEIADVEDLVVIQPRKFIEERGIDLRRHHEVVAIDREDQTVTVESDEGRYEAAYDELLLATGAYAALPDTPGSELQGVFSIRSLEAGRALRNYIAPHDEPPVAGVEPKAEPEVRDYLDETDPRAVGIIGANKIGIELAEAFAARGIAVHVFEAGTSALPAFGTDIAGMVEDHLREAGVRFHFEARVTELRGEDGRVNAVETADDSIDVEAVVADIGVDPNTELAEAAGIERGSTGAIATDQYGRTNDPRVYAAGDCAEKHHLLTDRPVHWPYALAANRAGRAIGRTVAGTPTPVSGIVGTLVMKAFDLQVARTGIVDHDVARTAGFDPVSATITTISRAHYYPGWSRIVVHATADQESGRLLGVNMVGEEGVAHRINTVATALTAQLTVREVGNLDLGYAPPFGPVWDPILGAAKLLGEELP